MGNLGEDPQEWLERLFSDEYCAECGGDAPDHEAVPFMGNWFARCLRLPIPDASEVVLWQDDASGWWRDAWDGWYPTLAEGLADAVGGLRWSSYAGWCFTRPRIVDAELA